jgi:hypothetical protein
MLDLDLRKDKASDITKDLIKDPFAKERVFTIELRYWDHGSSAPYWEVRIGFQNGNTQGYQILEKCKEFDDLLDQLKEVGEHLKSKS